MDNANRSGTNIIATVIGLVTLILGAAGVFGQLKDSLNTIWEIQPKPRSIVATIRSKFLSFTMVLGIGFLLLVSLVVSAGGTAGNLGIVVGEADRLADQSPEVLELARESVQSVDQVLEVRVHESNR